MEGGDDIDKNNTAYSEFHRSLYWAWDWCSNHESGYADLSTGREDCKTLPYFSQGVLKAIIEMEIAAAD